MNKRLARMEKLIWVLIYGGLLAALVGWFMRDGGDAAGQWLLVVGAGVAIVGVILIVVRSRLREGPEDSQPSTPAKRPSR